ncbi:MAG: DMT family transporter [Pseudomonadota bacterium]
MNAGEKPAPGVVDYALLLALAAIWGSAFLVIKFAVETVPAATLTLSRLAIASILLAVIARAMRQSISRESGAMGWIVLSALIGNALPFTLIAWGQEEIDSGVSAILMAFMPLSTVLMAHLFTRDEKLDRWKIGGVVFGTAGVVVLIGPAKLLALGDDVWRQLAVAGAALSYGLNAVVSKRLAGLPSMALVAWLMLISTVMMVPVTVIWDDLASIQPSTISLVSTLVLGVVHTAIGALMLFLIIQRQGATFFSQVNFLIPIIGVFYGAVLLGEQLGSGAYLALILILLGIALARKKSRT